MGDPNITTNHNDNLPKELTQEDKVEIKGQCAKTLSFQAILKSTVQEVLDSVSDEQFVAVYKSTLADFQLKDGIERKSMVGSSSEGKKYRKQFNKIVLADASDAIDCMMDQCNINEKFETLAKLEQTTSSRKAWRPPGNAKQHLEEFDCIQRIKQRETLDTILTTDKQEIRDLEMQLNESQARLKVLHDDVLATSQTIKKMVCKNSSERPNF